MIINNKICWNNLFSSSYDLASVSIISSNVITESSIRLLKDFPFSQLHEAGFQIQSFSHI